MIRIIITILICLLFVGCSNQTEQANKQDSFLQVLGKAADAGSAGFSAVDPQFSRAYYRQQLLERYDRTRDPALLLEIQQWETQDQLYEINRSLESIERQMAPRTLTWPPDPY